MQQPVRRERQLVVVVRIALAEKAQKMFVDEVEVPEAVHIAGRGMVADRMSLVGIRDARQNVPRRGNGKKQQQAA